MDYSAVGFIQCINHGRAGHVRGADVEVRYLPQEGLGWVDGLSLADAWRANEDHEQAGV